MNGIKLFRLFGITVFLHWSWFAIAYFQIDRMRSNQMPLSWAVMEYLMLFCIVLMHEFGHALACRSVGGQAERIMLWPLGGVAYVSPPPRPGAMLWSIAAGPLVNVVLLVPSALLFYYSHFHGMAGHLAQMFFIINATLLVFNIIPVYPLDGGQILQSLLWFVIGRGKSMAVATVIGMIGAVGIAILAIYRWDWWTGMMALFLGSQCWSGWKFGERIREFEKSQAGLGNEIISQHTEFACPFCGSPPPAGNYWTCSNCQTSFDTFATAGVCPGCGGQFNTTECGRCRRQSPISRWSQQPSLISPAQLIPPTAEM